MIAGSASADDRVRIVEVGARDGLQNQPVVVDIATRVGLVLRLQP